MSTATNLGIGVLLIAIGMVLGISVLPIVDNAVADYANGPDNVLTGTGTADNPPSSNVAVLSLAPLVLIFAIVLVGVGFLAAEGYAAVQRARA